MTKLFLPHLQQQLSLSLQKDIRIKTYQQVYGGDTNQTYIADTTEGKLFIKINEDSSPDLFQKEQNGLCLLKNKSILKIPEPILNGGFENIHFLVMECLEKSEPTLQTWKGLGEGMAALHQQTQSQFGLDHDNYIGNLPQQNHPIDTWAAFYAIQRILPLVQKAFNNHQCAINDVKDLEKLCAKFNELFPVEPPALLHGDLWSGNVMACVTNEAAIYDPAIYYGHREIDIAMTLLFGGFDKLFYHHYNEVYPLQSGWQKRVDLCQLYPLLVHLNLFGSSYYSRVKNILDKYK